MEQSLARKEVAQRASIPSRTPYPVLLAKALIDTLVVGNDSLKEIDNALK